MPFRRLHPVLAIGLTVLVAVACGRGPSSSGPASGGTPDPLAAGFAHPPESARPWVYWVWMDGNLSREGITADLEGMKSAGIGGVIIMEVNVGIPAGPVEFMSPVWRQHFTHVVREAERLGLQISLITGPGWTGSGGPWVKPEQGMQHIVGPRSGRRPWHFNDTLARPERRPAFFGDGLPLPRSGERTTTTAICSSWHTRRPPSAQDLRHRRKGILCPGAVFIAASARHAFTFAQYPPLPGGASIRQVSWTSRVATAEGLLMGCARRKLDHSPPWRDEHRCEHAAGSRAGTRTRMRQTGYCRPQCSLRSILRHPDPRDRAPGSAAGGWKMVHIDSWEMGAQNWTGAFREEFRQRRGYDLLPYLPRMTGVMVGNREISERFLWDLRQTVQELILQNHAGHLKTLGRRHGFTLSIEPYDMNPSPT